jgi:hypothetical protein
MRKDRPAGRALLGLMTLGLALTRNVAGQEPLPPLPPDSPQPMPVQPAPHVHNHAHADQNILTKLNPFRPFDPSIPLTVPELCKRLDCLTEDLRDDGLILLKQPDVYSQARMTRFRNDFDNQMSTDLGNFHLVLAARISRLDSATTTSTTALGAALSAPGTTNVTPPDATGFIGKVSGANSPFQNTTSLFPTNGQISQTAGPFGNLGLAPSNMSSAAANAATLGLGVDPTVYLDEKKRFLEHLNQIRRINQGPDQNDSSGYALYLVRMPVSIQPGECTYQGHGADLSLNVEHEFPPDFLPTTFQNLVINDLVDQLGPYIYEAIRTNALNDPLESDLNLIRKKKGLEITGQRAIQSWLAKLQAAKDKLQKPIGIDPVNVDLTAAEFKKLDGLTGFILRESKPLTGDPVQDRFTLDLISKRLKAVALASDSPNAATLVTNAALIGRDQELGPDADPAGGFTRDLRANVMAALSPIVRELSPSSPYPIDFERMECFLLSLYKTVMPEEVTKLDGLLGAPVPARDNFTKPMAANNQDLVPEDEDALEARNNLTLPTSRSPKQQYPIAPRELLDFFLRKNIHAIGKDADQAGRNIATRPNLLNVRSYLRQTLTTAYKYMTDPTALELAEPPSPGALPGILPLADPDFMDRLCETIRERRFNDPIDLETKSRLEELNEELIRRLSRGRKNLKGTPVGALCWAIAVDAAILDLYLRQDADKVFATKGVPANARFVRFYVPKGYPNPEGCNVFQEYVKLRWPIITFSLDPVNDQQNIADTFNLKRDLQLAVSFAFSTGQINFNQLNTFRRQIEQSSDAIALNRTVTGFSFSNDNFGFRFTPRFQNPPNQRTNIGVIASQLISGGPGPDYQIKHSKLEPGMRELTAVLLIPDFLPTMRLNIDSNWFKLNDPEHLVFHTGRAMERGRRVQELRKAVLDACSSQNYRGDDLRVLQKKLAQLEAMLPMQSKVVQLPFDSQANGFDLLSEGSPALAPELTGFSGVDIINIPAATAGASAGASGTATPTATPATFPVQGSNGVQLLTTTSPTGTTQTVSVAGGTSSIADIFVFGKFLSLLDTNVVAGGRSAAFQLLSREVMHVQIPSGVIPTTTEDGGTYIEIYASTPSGISNTILVPCIVGPTPATGPAPAYDLDAKSATMTVYYESQKAADGTTNFIPSATPSAPVNITWDDSTGVGPKQVQLIISGTIGTSQSFGFAMQAPTSDTDDYQIDQLDFAKALLKAIQKVVGPTGVVPPSIALTFSVQPYQPGGTDNFRVRTKQKVLKTKMNVTLQSLTVDDSALPKPKPKPKAKAPAADGADAADGAAGDQSSALPRQDRQGLIAAGGAKRDSDLGRTSQQIPGLPPLPSLPPAFNLPQPPAVSSLPTLLPPNVSNEAEQVARMLTGQPLPPTTAAGQTNTVIASTTVPNAATGQGQSIVVMPAPVVVVPAKEVEKKKHGHDRNQPGLLKKLGNRISNAMPGAGN